MYLFFFFVVVASVRSMTNGKSMPEYGNSMSSYLDYVQHRNAHALHQPIGFGFVICVQSHELLCDYIFHLLSLDFLFFILIHQVQDELQIKTAYKCNN